MIAKLSSLTVLALIICTSTANASITFSASGTGTDGNNISSSVTFSPDTHDFGGGGVSAIKITLTNTSDPINDPTLFRGNLLTSVFWSFTTDLGNLTTTSAGFDGNAALVRADNNSSNDVTNVDIAPAINNTATDGTYQLSNGAFGIANSGGDFSAYRYGISTVGMGLTGFSGSAVGGDNFGIATLGADLTEDGLGSVGNVIDTTAVFWIATPAGFTNWSQIDSKIAFGFGSLPDNTLFVPEPATCIIWTLLGASGIGFVVLRKRQSAKK